MGGQKIWKDVSAWEEVDENTQRLSRVIQKLPSGCAVIQGAEHWELINGNEEFFRIIGYTEDEIQALPNDFEDIVYREDREKMHRLVEELLHTDKIAQCEIRICGKKGEVHWISLSMRMFYYQGRMPHFLVACWDVHMRKKIEEELYLQTERYKLVEKINQEFPFEYDVKNKTIFIASSSNLMIADHNGKDFFISAKALEDIVYREDYEEFFGMLERASREEEEGTLEYRMNVADAGQEPEYAWYRTIYKSIPGENGQILRILGRTEDITRERLIQDEMELKLKQDGLTGLLNKSATKSEIEEFLKENVRGSHALMLIDVDNFKGINDTLGHMFGDNVLISVAKKIQDLFRATDIVGRIGGDEFMVLMKHTDSYQAELKAEKICKNVRQTYRSGGQEEIEVSCSVGVAIIDSVKESYGTLFAKADMAMYQAKASGKNRYKIAESIDSLWKVRRTARIEPRTGQYRAGKVQDIDFLSEAFTLLSHAKDVNDSLNVLTERIGRQYDLGIVAVLECNKEREEMIQTNCWNRENGVQYERQFVGKPDGWEGCMGGFDEWGLAYINDCWGDENISPEVQEAFRRKRIRAIVNCNFSYLELGEGCVSFCDLEKPRAWSSFEKETFLELTRVLSVFVALRTQREEDQRAIRREP